MTAPKTGQKRRESMAESRSYRLQRQRGTFRRRRTVGGERILQAKHQIPIVVIRVSYPKIIIERGAEVLDDFAVGTGRSSVGKEEERGERGGGGRDEERMSLELYRLHQRTDDGVQFFGEET